MKRDVKQLEREDRQVYTPYSRELRTRYEPKARIRLAYLNAVPWLDLLFMLFFLVWVQSRLILHPGMVVSLPAQRVQTGVQRGAVAVMALSGLGPQGSATVFFADEPFPLDVPERAEVLQQALRDAVVMRREQALTVYADERIRQRDLMRVMQMAETAGFLQFNLGTDPFTGSRQ